MHRSENLFLVFFRWWCQCYIFIKVYFVSELSQMRKYEFCRKVVCKKTKHRVVRKCVEWMSTTHKPECKYFFFFFDSDSWPAKINIAVPFYYLLLAFIILMTQGLLSSIYQSVKFLLWCDLMRCISIGNQYFEYCQNTLLYQRFSMAI